MATGRSWLAVVLTAAAIWTVSVTINNAQTATPAGGGNIGVVDLVYVFNNFEQTKALNKLLEEDTGRIKEEFDKKTLEIRTEKAGRDAFAPDSADWSARDKKYKEMLFGAQVWQAMEQDKNVQSHRRWLLRNYEMATTELGRIAKAKGIQVVITKEALEVRNADTKLLYQQIYNRKVVYADPAVDLTQEVLARLNAAFEKAGGIKSLDLHK